MRRLGKSLGGAALLTLALTPCLIRPTNANTSAARGTPSFRLLQRTLLAALPTSLDRPLWIADGPVDVQCTRLGVEPAPLTLTTTAELNAQFDRWELPAPTRDFLREKMRDAWEIRLAQSTTEKATLHMRGQEWAEEFEILLHPSPASFHYALQVGKGAPGLALAPAGHLEVLDSEGTAWLRMPRPFFIDAQGERHDGALLVNGLGAEPPDVIRIDLSDSHTAELTVVFPTPAPDAYPIVIDPTWSLTTTMSEGRERPGLVALEDGRALVVGGGNLTLALNSAEVFDPVTLTWTTTASLPAGQERWLPILTLLQSGKVLLTGGFLPEGTSTFNTAYVWNPQNGAWTTTATTMSSARAYHGAVRLDDGRVLVAGGGTGVDSLYAADNAVTSCDVYDPATNSFSPAAAMANARLLFGFIRLDNGTFLAVGGATREWAASIDVTSACEIYTPDSGAGGWAATSSLAAPRFQCAVVRLPAGEILRLPGSDGLAPQTSCEIFNAGTWTPAAPAPEGHDNYWPMAAIISPSTGVVLQPGGNLFGPVNKVHRYEAGTWSGPPIEPAMNANRDYGAGYRIEEGKMMVCGGRPDDTFTNFNSSTEIYEDLPGSNAPPDAPTALQQRQIDDVTVVADTTVLTAAQFRCRAALTDPNGDDVRLQVEIKSTALGFDGTGLVTSAPLAAGGTASVPSATLANGIAHHWRARTLDAKDAASAWVEFEEGAFEIEDLWTPDITAPAAVTDLAVTLMTVDTATLQWTAPGDDGATGTATTYDVRYSTSPIVTDADFNGATSASGEPAPSAAGTIESMGVVGLSPSTTYHFAVKTADEAFNWSVISGPNPTGTTASPDITPPAAVTTLGVAAVNATTVTLGWTAPGDDAGTGTATAYDIRYSTAPITTDANFLAATAATGAPVPSAAGTAESLTVGGLASGVTHYFAVKTADEVPNWSAISNVVAGSTWAPADDKKKRCALSAPGAIGNLANGLAVLAILATLSLRKPRGL
ncbi:MAG: hypothetical protein HYY16_15955 [Planctomycetes bacterium]|nr:hypothetical protein [Planctomycetota bacterium]